MPSLPPFVLTVHPATPFLPALAEALLSGALARDGRPPADPLALADATVYLPTRRAARALADALIEASGRPATLLPRIRALGFVDDDPLAGTAEPGAADGPDEPHAAANPAGTGPPIGALERRVSLASMIPGWAGALVREALGPFGAGEVNVPASIADAVSFAGELERLMDLVDTFEGDWGGLAGLVPEDHADYWRITTEFLRVATERYPDFLREIGRSAPARHRRLAIEAEAARLEREAPDAPVIVAGSTGSVPSTARLMAAVARLPAGALVLPGLDLELDADTWDALDGETPAPSHPQYGLKRLLARVGLDRAEVRPLGPPPGPALAARTRIVASALRPASTTDRWREDREAIGDAARREAVAGMRLVEATDEREEALAIAVGLREAIEEGVTAALVTPDRTIARRVSAEFRRWGVEVDDSAGEPLAATPAGILSRLVAEVASGADAAQFLALLKHPGCRLGLADGARLRAVATLECDVLRGPRLAPGLAPVIAAIGARAAAARGPLHRFEAARDLVERLAAALEPLTRWAGGDRVPLWQLAEDHRAALATVERASADADETIDADTVKANGADTGAAGEGVGTGATAEGSAGPGGVRREDTAETALAAALTEIAATRRIPLDARLTEWPAILDALLADIVVRHAPASAAPVHIWGPLEARLQSVGRLFVAGLNEGTWPAAIDTGPFMSREMMGLIGLEPPERRIGLAAHDVAMALAQPEVVLTRARRAGGTPTVASRWLLRLKAVLGEEATRTIAARGDRLAQLAAMLDAPEGPPRPTARPNPRPPLEARPTQLGVTEIATLIRDPYAVYARRVLKLKPLDPLAADPDAADRGMLVHAILAEFLRGREGPLGERDVADFVEIAERRLAEYADAPEVAAVWRPRLARIAAAFVAKENENAASSAGRWLEVDGATELPTANGPVTIRGRADRIEELAGGAIAIIDYKTGSPPSVKQVETHLDPQLAVEGMMARRGGFPGVDATREVARLVYVGVRADREPVKWREAGKEKPASQLIDEATEQLARLVAAYADPERGYLSRARVELEQAMDGDYDHLARSREWAEAVGEDE